MAQINLNVSLQTGMSTQQLKALENAVKSIASTFESIKPDKNLSATINALTRQYNALAKAAQSVQKTNNKNAIDEQKLALAKAKVNTETAREAKEIAKANTELAKKNKLDIESSIKIEKRAEAIERSIQKQEKLNKKTAEGTKAQKQNSESILDMTGKFAKWQIAATLLMQPLNLLRDAISSINETLVETESRVISLQRVLPSGSASDSEISGAMFGLAQKYGQTIDNVSDIANNFARTGMSWTETLEATEAALLALNVAELDATQSSDGLIAVMTQFKYEASDLMSIINMLNKTADNFPVTTEKLLKALQRTGSTAANANISLEDTIGLITTLSQATGRSGENLGTAVNSLISYSQKDSALNIFAQLSDTTDEIVKKYRQGGASILDVWRAVSAEMKSLDETQQSLLTSLANDEDIKNLDSELHDELGEIFEQTEDVYGTANTYRKSYFISLLENIDTVAEASKTAHQSEGYSQEENLKYLETYEARQNTLTAKWQELANDEQGLLSFKKSLVDIGILALDIVDGLGGIKSVLAQIAVIGVTAFAWFKPAAIATAFSGIKAGITGLIGIIPRAITVWKAYAAGIVKVNTAMRATQPIIGLVATALVGLIFYVAQADERLQESYDNAVAKIDELDSKIEENKRLIEEATNANGDNDAYIKRLERENTLLEAQRQIQEEIAREERKKIHEAALDELYANTYYVDDSGERRYESNILFGGGYSGKKRSLIDVLGMALTKAENTGEIDPFLKDYYQDFVKWFAKLEPSFLEPETLALFDGYLDRYNAIFNIQGEITDEQEEQDKNFQDQNKTLDDMSDKYEDIADALKEAKNTEQDAQKLLDKQNALLEAQQALAEAIAKARKDYVLDVLDDYVSSLEEANKMEQLQQAILEARQEAILEYLELQRQSTEETLSLEEKRLEVEKARQALLDAQNQRNVRVRNAQTGIWEYQANAKDVASAEEALANSIDSFNSFLEEQMWSELSEYIKDGNADTAEIEKIISKWQREWIGNDSPAWLNSVEQILSPSGTTIVDANEKVQSAVEALNKYLKDEAVKDLKELIESGNASSGTIRETLSKWMSLDGTGELATWGKNLADKLSEAVASGYYEASKVASAQQKVRDAEQALSEHIINMVWDEVSDLFKSGNASESALASVIRKYQQMGVASSVIDQILNTINGILGDGNSVTIEDLFPRDTEIGPNQPTYPVTDPDDPDYVDYFPYDNGGILNGMGGIKATAASEAVLPPSLTSKIIQPASNEAFTNFANSLGILYGVSERLARPSVVSNYNRGNDSHDTHYTLNGVPISASSADRYTIGELFESLAFFKS